MAKDQGDGTGQARAAPGIGTPVSVRVYHPASEAGSLASQTLSESPWMNRIQSLLFLFRLLLKSKAEPPLCSRRAPGPRLPLGTVLGPQCFWGAGSLRICGGHRGSEGATAGSALTLSSAWPPQPPVSTASPFHRGNGSQGSCTVTTGQPRATSPRVPPERDTHPQGRGALKVGGRLVAPRGDCREM